MSDQAPYTPAPIALFVYNRPYHTRQTVEALRANPLASSSELFVFSDAPRSETDCATVAQVRSYLHTVSGFKKLTLIERTKNLGLADSIISGVTDIVARFGKIIVLEDDLVTSPYFLQYMNEALEIYRDEELVISIHGYVYPLKDQVPELFFIRGADCWAWATWKRGWDVFQPDGALLLQELRQRKLERQFNFENSYPYVKMLEAQVLGKNSSWAVRWYASAFLANKLTLYPGRSLVKNVGFDDSGTHCGLDTRFDVELSATPIAMKRITVHECGQAFIAFRNFFRSIRPGFWQRQKNSILKRINRMLG
ncbi:glycosyltransferase [Trichlorobacter ammonificans]|uniref:Glycosyl transferase n=1 Tax=Trichlorobacter ammonificans TaxID=2916410 RepID=A0ABM9D6Y6_9BACT|nr:glycosyltransferase [Trichlorobacter ammonificans]CAH2030483.1 Glycosyl transferase [Trichlorobacter ammonificans]